MSTDRRKLKVGFVLESLELPAWQLALLETIQRSDVAEIALVVLTGKLRSGPPLLYRLAHAAFTKIERQLDSDTPDACAIGSGVELLKNETCIQIEHFDTDYRRAEDLIRSHGPDVVLALVDNERVRQWRSMAPLGCWYFSTNGMPFYPSDGSMAGLAETLWRKPCFSTTLRVASAKDASCRVAYETCSPVDHRSHAVTRNQHLWKCSALPGRALAACARLGCDQYMQSLPKRRLGLRHRTPAWSRQLAGMLLFPALFSYLLWRLWTKARGHLFSERWALLFAHRTDDFEHTPFERSTPPPGRFWADPHVVEHGGKYCVFFEDADQATGFGHISAADVSDGGVLSRPREVLRRPYHLSYPFVFKWNDEYFLVPESADNQTVELYRCVRFPDEWVFSHNLMEDIAAYDATLFEHQGLWWMFANVKERAGVSTWDELHLFWADTPISRQWNQHPGNPVISDVRRARPAGPLFSRNGRLFRPSQDSSGRYGRALNVNQVVELNTVTYREKLHCQLTPRRLRNALAVHTFSSAGPLLVVDAIIRESRFRHEDAFK